MRKKIYMSDTTPFDVQCDILGDFWLEYKGSESFTDFFQYNDLGLPLAYCFSSSILHVSNAPELAKSFIQETFDLLLESLDIPEDTGFETLADILAIAQE